MLMAEVGTSTDRDELAMNKCRLEIRGSSVLWTIPHGLVGELSSQRTQVTAELVCSLSCGETLLCTSHQLLIFWSNLKIFTMRSQPWPPPCCPNVSAGAGGQRREELPYFLQEPDVERPVQHRED